VEEAERTFESVTEEERFQEERRSGIGGSDVADIFNLEPYGCSLRCWYEKRGIAPDYEPTEPQRRAMRRGIKLESLIAEEYGLVTGRDVDPEPPEMVRMPGYEFIMVHMDRITHDPARGPRYLECKAPGYGVFRKVKNEGLLDGWVLQVQEGVMVSGATHGIAGGAYAVMDIPNWKLIHFDVEADPELQQLILDKCLEFWPRVENGPAPDPFPPTDPRCRKCEYRRRCHGLNLLENYIIPEQEQYYIDSPELQGLVDEVNELQDIEDEATALAETAREKLRTALVNPKKVLVRGGGANWYETIENRWDTEALNQWFAKLTPSTKTVFEKFRTKKPKRTLRVFRI